MSLRLTDTSWALAAGLAGLACVLGLIAGAEPGLAIAAALGLAFMLIAFADLAAGFAIFAFLSTFSVLNIAGTSESGSGLLTVWKVGALLLALSWLASIATREEPQREIFHGRPAVIWLGLLFVSWSILSLVWAEELSWGVQSIFQYAGYLVLLPIAYSAVREPKHVRWFFLALIAGAIAAGSYGLLSPATDYAETGRLTGAGDSPNALAMLTLTGLFLSIGLALVSRRSPILRGFAIAGAALCTAGLILTLSRGGLVGFGVALVISMLIATRRRGAIAAIAVLVAIGSVAYYGILAPPETRERITQSESGSGRLDIWKVGWQMVEEQPLTGVGTGNFIPSAPHYVLRSGQLETENLIEPVSRLPKYAHNMYLEIWAESGLVGLLLFLALVGSLLFSTARAVRNFALADDWRMETLARCLFAAQIGLLGMAFFESIQLSHALWLTLALGPAMLAMSSRALGPGPRLARSD